MGDAHLDSNGLTTKATINNADNMSVDSGFYQPTVEPKPQPTPEPNPEPTPKPHSGVESHVKHVSPQVQKNANTTKHTSQKETLPETGLETINHGLLGSLLAGLSALFLFRRKKQTNHKSN